MINPYTFPGGGTMTQRPSPMVATSSSTEGSEKKVRKPYTITKSREIWTDEEHDKFLEALQLFDRDWKKIEVFVASKTVIQIRSHAQKYFLKVQKNGTLAHVPPPRPKRKASHPFPPQKDPNSGLISIPTSFQYHSSVGTMMPVYSSWSSKALLLQDKYTALHRAEADDIGSKGMLSSNSFSSLKTIGRALSSLDVPKQGQQLQMIRGGIPDFAEVYSLLGNLFDPIEDGHGDKLKEMDPITYQTVLLLMNNIAYNLCDPVCEPHIKVIWSYAVTVRTEGVTAEIQMSDVKTSTTFTI